MTRPERFFAWSISTVATTPFVMVAGFVWADAVGNPEVPFWPGGLVIMLAVALAAVALAYPLQRVLFKWMSKP